MISKVELDGMLDRLKQRLEKDGERITDLLGL